MTGNYLTCAVTVVTVCSMTWQQLLERLTKRVVRLELHVEFRPAKCGPLLPSPAKEVIPTHGEAMPDNVVWIGRRSA